MVNANGTAERQLTGWGTVDASGPVVWSPDGTRIMFATGSIDSGGPRSLFVIDVATGAAGEITTARQQLYPSDWQP